MSLVIPPGFVNAAFTFTGAAGTQPYITTLGFDASAYGGDWVNAANQAMAVYATNMTAETSSALVLDRVTLTVGSDGPGGSVDSNLPPVSMTRSGSFPPTAASAIARKVTNDLGRRGRGRMFIPGIVSENELDQDGSITTPRRNAINVVLDAMYDDFVAGDAGGGPLLPVLFHSSAPTDPTPITGLVVSDLIGWIRGRIR